MDRRTFFASLIGLALSPKLLEKCESLWPVGTTNPRACMDEINALFEVESARCAQTIIRDLSRPSPWLDPLSSNGFDSTTPQVIVQERA